MNSNNSSPTFDNGSIEVRELFSTYLKYWKWFVLSVLLALICAFLFIRYSIPEYEAKTQIQILDQKGGSSELQAFSDLNILAGGKNEVEDELQLINSRSNMIEVVKKLRLNTTVKVIGKVISNEVYKDPPIKLIFKENDSIINRTFLDFYITPSSSTTFELSLEDDAPPKRHTYGETIETKYGDVIITPNNRTLGKFKGKKLRISVRPVVDVALAYRNRVHLSTTDEFSNIIDIRLQDPIKEKAKDILNALVRIYNENAVKDKQVIADRTSKFIEERIADIYSSLSDVDQSAQDFKTERGVTDIASEANINLNVGIANQQELENTRNQMQIAESMQLMVQEDDPFTELPTNIGIDDPSVTSTTQKINELVLERKRLLKSSNEQNPMIVRLNEQIQGLRGSLQSSLKNRVDNLGLTVNALSGQQARFNSRIYSTPRNERALREITRKQQTTEQLYLYLLQKREEAKIAVASTSPKSKVIDAAYETSRFPVSPKTRTIYLAAFLLGMLVPFSVVYLMDLMDNKVVNMYTLEKIVKNVPVLGELPKLDKKEERLVVKDDRSVLAESLRIIRTNLDYLINTKRTNESKSNVVFVTSGVPGEGKTFLSTNLAVTLASTRKKVLLIGGDIRNPKFYTLFTDKEIDKMSKPSRNKDAGLTEFIFDNAIMIKDIVNPMLVGENNIDVIYSGKIPPNPAELLLSDRLEELFLQVSKTYDYVIVDTAPLMVVTDTLLISKYANHFIYVTRAGVTETKSVDFPIKLQEEKKITGLSFVVNGVSTTNLGYGGKYGYGYHKSTKKWWRF